MKSNFGRIPDKVEEILSRLENEDVSDEEMQWAYDTMEENNSWGDYDSDDVEKLEECLFG